VLMMFGMCRRLTVFEATGSIELSLDCQEEYWRNEEWGLGSTGYYSRKMLDCDPVSFMMMPDEITRALGVQGL
jgi:hypothetical protein